MINSSTSGNSKTNTTPPTTLSSENDSQGYFNRFFFELIETYNIQFNIKLWDH
jgi:hypothetical protein